jgi:hypothetical protein
MELGIEPSLWKFLAASSASIDRHWHQPDFDLAD